MPSYVAGGQHVSFSLGKLDLTSQGSPANTSVDVYAKSPTSASRTLLGTFPVTDGTAAVDLDVPAGLPANSPLSVVASPSMTTVGKAPTPSSITATTGTVTYAHDFTVHVAVDPAEGNGSVYLWAGTYGYLGTTPQVVNGVADIVVHPNGLPPGSYSLLVGYRGDATHAGSSTALAVTVRKATPEMAVSAPEAVRVGRTRAKVTVHVGGPGAPATGRVLVHAGGGSYLATVTGGKATVRLAPFARVGTHTVRITYLGDDHYRSLTRRTTIKVMR
jgi:5'-nucleotidase